MLVRLVLGLLLTLVVAVVAARRGLWLYRLIASGQPDAKRADGLGARVRTQLVEVFGQRRLLRWSVPGVAHLFTFWGFVILITVYLEAYGALFVEDFSIPLVGHWAVLGFVQDFIAVMVLLSTIAFSIMRVQQAPERRERASRFYGSHTGGAWLILFMIFNVVWTLFAFRGVSSAAGNLPYDSGAWGSIGVGELFAGLSPTTLFVLETVFLLLHIGVGLSFLVIVLYSKHLHIFLAPVNVSAKRYPKALGPLQPLEFEGKPIDFEDPPEEASFGRGKAEDFTWKGLLDFSTCTECGRCQSQCPAWNTGKPLSPKLLIMDLRDHVFAKAPYMIEGKAPDEGALTEAGADNPGHGHGVPESGYERHRGTDDVQALRPLVGDAQSLGVIDPEVLWSCTSCGACVEQCPVDIEHVDHIMDMRRHQVMIESEFPTELGVLFKNLENKGNPWGQNNSSRMDWAKDLPFEVPEFDGELAPETEYLFFIGCAGAFDDNARKTVRAVAELLHIAGVNYTVLGKEESCTGDPARRSGNEFLFQMMAAQTKEMLDGVFEGREPGTRKIVTTCPHCMNTLGREYPQLDGHYEVVHHTQLLNQLVREKKLVPVAPEPTPVPAFHSDISAVTGLQARGPRSDGTERGLVTANGHASPGHGSDQAAPAAVALAERDGASSNGHGSNGHASGRPTVTYHDPCYLGRHNEVYSPPRELVAAAGAVLTEMPRHADRAMCCGAGGARMWMEEKIGKRINMERVDEAISTEPDTIATGCPFCRVMLTDGLTERQNEAKAVGTEVLDVSQMLLAAVKRGTATDPAPEAETDGPGDTDPSTSATSANVGPTDESSAT